jgi:tetratricopeptide (TPR) repeat protein
MAATTPVEADSHPDAETNSFVEAKRRLFPPLRNSMLARAADALAINRPDLATALIARVLDKNPEAPEALNLMADIARRELRFEDAERLLSRCIALAPESAGFRFNYVVILRRLERFEEALEHLELLLRADPPNPLYRNQQAALLRAMGRHQEALGCLRELADENPNTATIWLDYADALRSAGFGRDCIAAYHKALALSPSLLSVYSQLADLKTYRFTPAEITQMETQLARSDLPARDRGDLHFALGKAYDDESLYAKAFDNYARGNALLRIGNEYNVENLNAYRQSCELIFSEQFFRERADWGSASEAPIFIVGMPRSGSTLIEQILSSHSAIEGLGELPNLDSVVGECLSDLEHGRPPHEFWITGHFEFRQGLVECFPRALERMPEEDFRRLAEAYLETTSQRRTHAKPHFTDKGLRNFGYTGLIAAILPRAKIIDMRRHPLDCGWSCFRSHFPGGQPFAHRLADIGRVYANYAELMAHFDRVLPRRIHRVSYEGLIADPELEIGRLFDYVGLAFEDQCLRFYENRRAAGTISSEQVRTPLHAGGINRWRPYEPWLVPLQIALGPLLERYRND